MKSSTGGISISASIVTLVLWMLAGAFCGLAAAPLVGRIEHWKFFAIILAAAFGFAGLLPSLRGRIGVPIVTLGGASAGWLAGFLSGIWRLGAIGVLAGAAGGFSLGRRLQLRFTRNTARGKQDSSGFYRST